MTIGEYRSRHAELCYAPTIDQFRQIAQVAAAQQICVINGAYVYVMELMEKFPYVFEEGRVRRIEADDILESFDDLDDLEEAQTREVERLSRPPTRSCVRSAAKRT